MSLVTNLEAQEIIVKHLQAAKEMINSQIIDSSDYAENALHHVEVYCNIAMNLIDKYLDLSEPKQVECFFQFKERTQANLNHLKNDFKLKNDQIESHANGLIDDLCKLIVDCTPASKST